MLTITTPTESSLDPENISKSKEPTKEAYHGKYFK
jgi:hypothetical protein